MASRSFRARKARIGEPAGAALLALGVGAASMSFAFEPIANGGMRDGMPAFPFLMFGTVALIGSIGGLVGISAADSASLRT